MHSYLIYRSAQAAECLSTHAEETESMTEQELAGRLIDIARTRGDLSDRFPIVHSIKEAVRQIKAELPELTLESVLEAADQAYDLLIGPINLPGPDPIVDRLVKAAMSAGIKQAWQLLDLEG